MITVRLPTVDSVSAYLESVQDEVAAVIIAKRTLLRAKSSNDVLDMRITIDERVQDIAIAMLFGSQIKALSVPERTLFIARTLVPSQKGPPLLGSILGHEDERSVFRDLFLNASFDLSLRMVAPRCLMHEEFEELPAYALAMQSDAVVVLVAQMSSFGWALNLLLKKEKVRQL